MAPAIAGLLVLAGCATPPVNANLHSLDSGSAPPRIEGKTAYTVAVEAVRVPAAVDRPQIVTRSSANDTVINDLERWSDPLKLQIGRVIAANLAHMLQRADAYAYPETRDSNPDCKIAIEVQRFDSMPGVGAIVEVMWTVRLTKGTTWKGRSQVHDGANSRTYDGLVAAHGRALAVVSREIAEAINTMR
jgi:uncharacterized protein